MAVFSVSLLIYLSATLIDNQLNMLHVYFKLCRDPFTMNRLLDEYTEVMVKVYQANKFVKFVLGSVNFLAVPVVSMLLSLFSVAYYGIITKTIAFTAGASFFILLVSTAAFMATVHNKVKLMTMNLKKTLKR